MIDYFILAAAFLTLFQWVCILLVAAWVIWWLGRHNNRRGPYA